MPNLPWRNVSSLVALSLPAVACTTLATLRPTRHPSRDRFPATAAPSERSTALPAYINVRAHLPGASGHTYLQSSGSPGIGGTWALTGCVTSAADGACHATQTFALTSDLEAFTQLWHAIDTMPRCEPEGIWPGDRSFQIEGPGFSYNGTLPADPAAIPERTTQPCAAPGRLVV